jgi:hypothetical protein
MLVLSVGCLAVVPVTCNSIFAPRKVLPDSEQYEYVTISGSNIPQRVKKGEQAVSASQVDTVSAETFRKAVDQLRVPPPRAN